ncbi:MAG TPA: flagellar basal body rod protein FlgC [Solirubrobacteraceae bacterium]|jgi:flagellar basal-body rod protein FlgC
MALFEAIDIAGSGLTAERVRMDVTAENLANAQTTKTASGGPYQRQEVVLQQVGSSDFGTALAGALEQPGQGGYTGSSALSAEPDSEASALNAQSVAASSGEAPAGGVEVAGIVNDKTPDQLVYNPSSPEANAKGYVEMPNVDTVTEMTDLISESRSYDADVTAMQTAKTMFNTTLGLLK